MLPFITCLLTHKDNYYGNYLTGNWISNFDPFLSWGQIFGLIFRSWKVDLYTEKDGTPVSPCSETTICLFKMSISNQQTIANTTNLVSEVLYVNQQCTQLQHKTTCSVPLNLTSKWQFTFNIAYMYHPEFNLNLAFFSPMSINLMT